MKDNEALIILDPQMELAEGIDIPALVEKWKDVPVVVIGAENVLEVYKQVKRGHLDLVSARNKVEKTRKSLKSPAIEFGKMCDFKAREYKELMADTEARLFVERKKWEDYEAEKEQKKINDELDRVDLINSKVATLREIPSNAIGKSVADLKEIYESIVIPDEEIYQEQIDLANEVYKDTITKLEVMIEQITKAEEGEVLAREAEEKRAAEQKIIDEKAKTERAEFEREKAEFQKEKDALNAEKNAKAESERMQQVEIEAEELADRQAKESQDRLQESQEIAKSNRKETLEGMARASDKNGLEGILDAIIKNEIRGLRYER